MADSKENHDHLSLGSMQEVRKMMSKNGGSSHEKVLFSDLLVKINKKEKEQTRVLLITDKALYNMKPNKYSSCQRRIALDIIDSVSISSVSNEFVVHVGEEYDYRFKGAKKQVIAAILKKAASINSRHVAEAQLREIVLTKDVARVMSREDKMKRKQQLAAEAHDSDDEDRADAKRTDGSTEMLTDSDSKVSLSDFELLKVLGRGSFGKVMQVRKKSDGKVYAMKILKKKAIIERNQVEHTKSERKILESTKSHPFLMSMRYAFQSKEKLYFVLDYFTGGELFFHLKAKRRFSEATAKIYVAEIAHALGFLHDTDTIYRDLKPENILLDEGGHVCLTDFGLSKEVPDEDSAHTFCGTPEYLAPEIVTGSGHGKPVDWWSLGILLYELTVGIPPFYSQNVNEMYNKIQHGVLRFPPFLTESCKNLITALLNRDPSKRLGSKDGFRDIQDHPFFASIDWNKLLAKDIDVPYKPKVKSDQDTSNFDATFTSEPVVDSMVPVSQLADSGQSGAFSGFTYQKPTNL
jgi:serum/glucocorticoid-regulated kinase 2